MPDLTATGVPAHADPGADADAVLLAGLPDDPAALVWPSQVWNTHLATCARPRRCPHIYEVVLPAWWVALVRRRTMPLAVDPTEALALAMQRINGYRGGKDVTAIGAAFARDVVRDALPGAPQPVTKEWVVSSLAITGGIASWAHNEGEPLTREHIFAEATRQRYFHGPNSPDHLSKHTARNYRLRLDVVAVALLGSQREILRGKKAIGHNVPLLPLTPQQQADLWVWSEGLRPITARRRLQVVIVCGLGVGVRRRDLAFLQAGQVTRNEHGVHVPFPATTPTGRSQSPARVVTCAAQWEDRLWTLVQSMHPDEFVAAVTKPMQQPSLGTIDRTLRDVINDKTPPVDFSSESLRNTWLVHRMEEGVPNDVLLEKAGLNTMTTLDKLRPFMREPTEDETMAWMRGARRP